MPREQCGDPGRSPARVHRSQPALAPRSPLPEPRAAIEVRYPCSSWQEFLDEHLIDVGGHGMFIPASRPLPVGTAVQFRILLWSEAPHLSGLGVVIWTTEGASERGILGGMELRFDALDPESEERFSQLAMVKRGALVATSLPPPAWHRAPVVPPAPAVHFPWAGEIEPNPAAPDYAGYAVEVQLEIGPDEAEASGASLAALARTALAPLPEPMEPDDPEQLFHLVDLREIDEPTAERTCTLADRVRRWRRVITGDRARRRAHAR